MFPFGDETQLLPLGLGPASPAAACTERESGSADPTDQVCAFEVATHKGGEMMPRGLGTSAASRASVISRPVSIATRAPARSASNSSLSASNKAVRAVSVVSDADSDNDKEADICGGFEFMRR